MKRQALVVLAWLLVGCGYGGDASEGPYETYPCGSPRQALIDTGAELELDAGKGVGLLMEYLGDGEWRVRTSCDTRRSGYDCDWDILIWAEEGNTLSDFTGEDLEAGDVVGREWDGALHLRWITGTDSLLDGACANPYMYWIGDGAVHTGSPSNPLDLTPTEP
jgi:hypothetical protein